MLETSVSHECSRKLNVSVTQTARGLHQTACLTIGLLLDTMKV